MQGLKARLDDRLAPTPGTAFQFNEQHGIDNDWEIGDCLAQWWRPNFETFMVSPLGVSFIHQCRMYTVGCTYLVNRLRSLERPSI